MIDWSKAPKDATHAGIRPSNRVCWYKSLEEGWQFMYEESKGWTPSRGTPVHGPLIPSPFVRRGMKDGGPFAGAECEYTFKAHNEADYCEWDRCTVMYLSKYGVVIKEAWGAEAFFDYVHYDLLFRPIQSERDNFAVEVVSSFAPLTASYKETSMIAEVARKMYDEGYRRVPGSSLDDEIYDDLKRAIFPSRP